MKEFEYVIQDVYGIHARPAGQLVRQAKAFDSQITVAKGSETADAKKLFALMSLCVKKDDTIHITVEGPDEAEAAQSLQDFLSENL